GEAGDAGREEPLPPPRRQKLEQAHGHPVEDLRARHAGPVRGEGRELPDVARPDAPGVLPPARRLALDDRPDRLKKNRPPDREAEVEHLLERGTPPPAGL